ncbi:MAG: DNA-binding protein [Myxococcales bacterium]|nr:DNA-binding protein [Myxococcales bacterium]
MRRLTRDEISEGIALAEYMDYRRPQSRADCASGPRPCPFVSCKHHLYLDVNPNTGSIKINFPDVEVWEMSHTCALDVAERGGITLEEVGSIMNLTRERIRQVEVNGLDKLQQERFASEVDELETLDS